MAYVQITAKYIVTKFNYLRYDKMPICFQN